MKAKKSLGQNFLNDKNVLESIVLFAGVAPGSRVLEIGPGRGALTENLLDHGAIVQAIELDADLIPELEKKFGSHPRFSVQEDDILTLSLARFYQSDEPYQVVANIPYYITAPIIQKLLTEEPTPERVTLLVQKEVAERLAGGAKTRSVLTVATQFYSHVQLGPVIPRDYFDPVPKVDSQLVMLIPYRKKEASDEGFFRLVRAGFAARRKTLLNNLLAHRFGTKEELESILTEINLPLTVRAQDLEIVNWQQLSAKLSSLTEEKK